jgi:acetolactate synthase regulatory subunit
MEVRLGRNLEALSAAQAQADKAPPTVERVLRGVAAGRGLLAAAAADSAGDDV